LQRLGVEAQLSADAERIRAADRVILPGVGAAAPGMRRLHELDLVETLRALRQPVLGVCLGMQLMFEHSQESDTECLGIFPGSVQRLDPSRVGRVPHMGWNQLEIDADDALLDGLDEPAYAYFVHSYAAPIGAHTVAACDYGGYFSAIVRKDNFIGMQFHPERSAAVGARLLGNFLEWNAC
jgi:imidazole glycerol-phosphate synthase subunit HisH